MLRIYKPTNFYIKTYLYSSLICHFYSCLLERGKKTASTLYSFATGKETNANVDLSF